MRQRRRSPSLLDSLFDRPPTCVCVYICNTFARALPNSFLCMRTHTYENDSPTASGYRIGEQISVGVYLHIMCAVLILCSGHFRSRNYMSHELSHSLFYHTGVKLRAPGRKFAGTQLLRIIHICAHTAARGDNTRAKKKLVKRASRTGFYIADE